MPLRPDPRAGLAANRASVDAGSKGRGIVQENVSASQADSRGQRVTVDETMIEAQKKRDREARERFDLSLDTSVIEARMTDCHIPMPEVRRKP